ncbi:MAG: TraB/GumN family protein [Desulfarculaceae bacterium]|nr:TraB/GumN family protein [Desulfarculaceae bacterium]
MDSTEDQNMDNVNRLSVDGKEILLVGTAHVSRESAEFVKTFIEKEAPDTVCVELCPTRLHSLRDNDRWRNMDIVRVIKEKKSLLLLMNLILASFQKKMAEKFKIQPGQEMLNAVEAAEKIEAVVVPADRDIQTTLARVWRSMGFFEKVKFIFQLLFSLGGSDDITEEDIEKMKQEDILKTLLSDVKKSHPVMERVLIDERDMYLAGEIANAPGNKIVAVVGAGHVPGIKRYINSGSRTGKGELNRIPPGGNLMKSLKWIIPAAIVVIIAAGFLLEGKGGGTDMIWAWVLANAVFGGLGAIAALAHPLTILASIAAAPLTSLNPVIAAGWVSGLVEAFSRKPKVKDLESIPTDIMTIKGFWKNNVIRILLVVIFTNLGSTVGTMTAVPLMLRVIN